jgi:hypothetical protein
MTAGSKRVLTVIAVTFVLYVTGVFGTLGIVRGFGPMESLVSLMALLPFVFIGGLIWFGIEVISSLRRIEAAVRDEDSIEPEFSRRA